MTTGRCRGAERDGEDEGGTFTIYSSTVRPSEFLRQWTPSPSPGTTAETTDRAAAPAQGQAQAHAPSPARSPFEGDPKIVFRMAQPSGVTKEGLGSSLKEKIGATWVEIEDMSGGCGQAYSAIIVSPLFEKKTTLARHRMVNTALKTEVAAIHAWTPKCYTPEQWEKLQVKGGEAVQAPGKATNGEVVEGTSA